MGNITTALSFEELRLIMTVSYFTLTAFSLWVLIKSAKKLKFLYLLIPLVLVLAMSTWKSTEMIMGYPIESDNTDEQVYITHYIGPQKTWIFVWAIDQTISLEPRSYRIPYTVENEKKLAEAKQRQQKGMPQGVRLPAQDRKNNEAETERSLQLYDFDRLDGVQKTRN